MNPHNPSLSGAPPSQAELGPTAIAALDSVLEPLAVMRAVRDDAGVITDFEWLYINRAGSQDVGRSPDEMLGKRLLSLLPGHRDGLFDSYVSVVETGEPLLLTGVRYRDDWGDGRPVEKVFDIRAVRVGDGFAVYWSDRTKELSAREELRSERIARNEADSSFETLFNSAPIGMAVVALDGSFRSVNPALCRILGYGEDELRQLTFQDITHPDDLDADVSLAQKLYMGEGDRYAIDKRYFTADGHVVWVHLSVAIVRDSLGAPQHYISQIQDISRRKRDEEMLRRMAQRDELTGAFNRRKFDEEVLRAEAAVSRFKETWGVLLIDIDGLKEVNDRDGHAAGDEYIKGVAQAIRRRVRLTDSFARYGGDEFAVLMQRVEPETALSIAQEIVEIVDDLTLGSVSVGLAMLTVDTLGLAVDLADRAMYQAKRSGGNACAGPLVPDDVPSLPRDGS